MEWNKINIYSFVNEKGWASMDVNGSLIGVIQSWKYYFNILFLITRF